MDLQEFKAWFEGYTEEMKGPPNEKQWKKINEKIKEINGVRIVKEYFYDYYKPYFYPPYTVTWGGNSVDPNKVLCGSLGNTKDFNSVDAMYYAGKMDSKDSS